MNLFNFIFQLGVLFAVYGFIWGIFEFGYSLLIAGRKRSIMEAYVIKAVKYIFLVDVVFLFCMKQDEKAYSSYTFIIAGLVILMYFVGKLQRKQNQQMMIRFMNNEGMKQLNTNFNLLAEITVIVLSLLFFTLLFFFPGYANMPVSLWFYDSIQGITNTPVIGFIFKVIGFFFLTSMILKMINGFGMLISGRPFVQVNSSFRQFRDTVDEDQKENDDSDFDDYEEMK